MMSQGANADRRGATMSQGATADRHCATMSQGATADRGGGEPFRSISLSELHQAFTAPTHELTPQQSNNVTLYEPLLPPIAADSSKKTQMKVTLERSHLGLSTGSHQSRRSHQSRLPPLVHIEPYLLFWFFSPSLGRISALCCLIATPSAVFWLISLHLTLSFCILSLYVLISLSSYLSSLFMYFLNPLN